MDQIVLREMELEDVDQVHNIEELSFATPWSKEAFINEIEQNKFATYIVLELEGVIVGYCGIWLVIDEAHITNIAILPEFRGKKLGEFLFKHVIDFAKKKGATLLSLEVRVSNIVAQKLYRKFGLIPGGIRKNYYVDNQEDAVVMWVNL
ncbi:ribosomal protein S18-alanine N-acetyltransferase [Bacillaceae bacterium S4-13-58]